MQNDDSFFDVHSTMDKTPRASFVFYGLQLVLLLVWPTFQKFTFKTWPWDSSFSL